LSIEFTLCSKFSTALTNLPYSTGLMSLML